MGPVSERCPVSKQFRRSRARKMKLYVMLNQPLIMEVSSYIRERGKHISLCPSNTVVGWAGDTASPLQLQLLLRPLPKQGIRGTTLAQLVAKTYHSGVAASSVVNEPAAVS
jgi:hypothetical protein